MGKLSVIYDFLSVNQSVISSKLPIVAVMSNFAFIMLNNFSSCG